jgi:hypothetical protein
MSALLLLPALHGCYIEIPGCCCLPCLQMDAAVLAALPWSVQKELIERSGRGRQQQSLVRQFEAAAAGAAGQAGATAGPDASAAAAAGVLEGQGQANAQQQGQQRAIWQLEQEQEERGQAVQQREGKQQVLSSDEEDGWEPDSQPDAAIAAPGRLPDLTLQPQQQPGAGASGSGASGSGGGRTPIVALPAFSQVDPAVLGALPLELRVELERAYGESTAWVGGTKV